MKTIAGLAATVACIVQVAPAQTDHRAPEQLDNPRLQGTQSSQSVKRSRGSQPLESIRASKLIGSNVSASSGENFGQVKDLVFDPITGKIQFALVSKGFMAGAGESVVPVPWQAMTVKAEQQYAVNLDETRLQAVPAWSETESQAPDYVIRVYRFFAIPEPEGMGAPGAGQEESGQGQQSSAPPSQPQPEQKLNDSAPGQK